MLAPFSNTMLHRLSIAEADSGFLARCSLLWVGNAPLGDWAPLPETTLWETTTPLLLTVELAPPVHLRSCEVRRARPFCRPLLLR